MLEPQWHVNINPVLEGFGFGHIFIQASFNRHHIILDHNFKIVEFIYIKFFILMFHNLNLKFFNLCTRIDGVIFYVFHPFENVYELIRIVFDVMLYSINPTVNIFKMIKSLIPFFCG